MSLARSTLRRGNTIIINSLLKNPEVVANSVPNVIDLSNKQTRLYEKYKEKYRQLNSKNEN